MALAATLEVALYSPSARMWSTLILNAIVATRQEPGASARSVRALCRLQGPSLELTVAARERAGGLKWGMARSCVPLNASLPRQARRLQQEGAAPAQGSPLPTVPDNLSPIGSPASSQRPEAPVGNPSLAAVGPTLGPAFHDSASPALDALGRRMRCDMPLRQAQANAT